MEMKDTLSSCSYSKEQQMQQIQDKAKKSCMYFLEYTQLEVEQFRDTLIQHMESVKKSIDKRALHKREYDNRVNEKQMQTKEGKHDTSSRSGNDVDVDNADIKPVYDEVPMAEFAKPSILGKLVLHTLRNQSVVRQPIAFKSERPRILKPRFASQVDVNNDMPKPVTTHYLPKERESGFAKPYHMTASSESRNSSKNMPRFSSNDMVHNHFLKDAKKKTQERGRNSRPSVMPFAKSQSTTNDSKPKPRINNQKSRNWPASKTSYITTKTVPIAEHSRNSRNFSDTKHFVCSTCQKCVFNANHDSCVTKFLNEVNSRAKVPSHKTTNKNKPVKQISVAKKSERQILTGHRFSTKKTFVVHKKTFLRSCLRRKPTGRILKTVGLRWVPTGKIFTSSTTTFNSELPHGSNTDITNLHECIQNLDSSAGTSINVQEEQTLDLNAGTPFNLKKERIKVWIKENVISRRPRIHGITLIQEISARPKSQGIRCLLTS
ncbi:hypothetical protein Tco_0748126 [Tanacetum coccineum]|uniref:Uncharacterized protein n=1 Tax=Tanacetum coccineum TaxID=301880 RepID=A0ABQ4YUY0_9ASTR